MKFLIFFMALLGVAPGVALCSFSRRFLMLAAFAMLLPIAMYNQTAVNFLSFERYRGSARGMEISLIYLIALTIIGAVAMRRKLPPLFPDWGSRLYLLYFILSLFAFKNAENRLFCWFELWKMIMMYLVFYAVYAYLSCVHDPSAVLAGLGMLLIFCFFSVVKQHVLGISQARGFFPHQNSMAMFMMFVTPIFFAWYLNAPEKTLLWRLATFAFICGSASIVRSYSRGAIACFPVACFLTIAASFRRNFTFRLPVRLLPLVLLGLLGVIAILPKVIQRFETSSSKSGETRKELAEAAFNMVRDKPWFGVGLNNWGIKINWPYEYTERRSYLKDEAREKYKDGVVESAYLLVLAECGIPTFVVFLLWLFYYWVVSLRLLKRLAGTRWFCIPAGVLGGLTGCCLQTCLEWCLKQQVNFSEMMVCFAMLSFLNRNWREMSRSAQKALS